MGRELDRPRRAASRLLTGRRREAKGGHGERRGRVEVRGAGHRRDELSARVVEVDVLLALGREGAVAEDAVLGMATRSVLGSADAGGAIDIAARTARVVASQNCNNAALRVIVVPRC